MSFLTRAYAIEYIKYSEGIIGEYTYISYAHVLDNRKCVIFRSHMCFLNFTVLSTKVGLGHTIKSKSVQFAKVTMPGYSGKI